VEPLEVVVAERLPTLRLGLALLLRGQGVEVTGTAETPAAATDLILRRRPHVAVVDAALDEGEPLGVARGVLARWPGARILVYYAAGEVDATHVEAGLEAGIGGFLSKGAAFDDLLAAIRTVFGGERYVGAGAWQPPTSRRLTRRELQILRLLARGMTSEQVAAELVISRLTVHTHVRNLMAKLGANTRTHALALAVAGRELELPGL
jgi:DNA-binding NarL/FixJ family response regulator